jgi:hypothetical protein
MEGNYQCKAIITIAHPPGTKRKRQNLDYLVNTMQKTNSYSPRRNFKTTGRWHKKVGTEQSGYQFK